MAKKDKVIDISWPISTKATSYKNKLLLKIIPMKIFNRDKVRETQIIMSSHTGTHIDAPSHFIKNGKNIDEEHLIKYIGASIVCDLTDVNGKITQADLQKHKIRRGQIVLLKTKNSSYTAVEQFNQNFIYLATDAAKYLVKKQIKAIGIDYLSLERGNKQHPVHQIFLKANIPIIEGLRLAKARESEYYFVCLPMAFVGIEAAPARAILIDNQ